MKKHVVGYCAVEKQTREEAVAMYLSDQPEVVAEMLCNCNDALDRTIKELTAETALVSNLTKRLMHMASGVRENNVEAVRRYLREAAGDLAQHGYDTEASVITKYLEDPDVRLITQD